MSTPRTPPNAAPRPGRPPLAVEGGEARTQQLTTRLTRSEQRLLKDAANGVPLAEWAREALRYHALRLTGRPIPADVPAWVRIEEDGEG